MGREAVGQGRSFQRESCRDFSSEQSQKVKPAVKQTFPSSPNLYNILREFSFLSILSIIETSIESYCC